MPFIIIALLSFMLTGCVMDLWKHKPYQGAIFVYVQTPEEIQRGWERRTGNKKRVGGWALWSKKSKLCRIYVPPLNDNKSYEIWRHELRHCQDGNFHGSTKNFSHISE